MTTDHIQNKHLLWRSRIAKFRELDHTDENGFELTRLENFLDGRHDIFDVLEKHAANKEALKSSMEIHKPSRAYGPEKPKTEGLNDFWEKLKKQLKRLREEEKI